MGIRQKNRRIQFLLYDHEKDRVIQDFLDTQWPKQLNGGYSGLIKSLLYNFILESKNSRKYRKKTIQTEPDHNRSIEKKSIEQPSQRQRQTTNQRSSKQITNALNSIMAASKKALIKK